MISIQKYVRVKSLDEAYELNQARNNQILGGMLWIKMGRGSINTAIDLSDLSLDTIEETDEEFLIGAMTSLRSLELHEGLNRYTQDAMKHALCDIVGVQFRNMATIGGSIWGRFGFSDVLTIFLAMDTYVELYKGGVIPLKDFSQMKYNRDLLIRVIVKKKPAAFVYQAVRAQRTDFPILTSAVSCIEGTYRAVIGARPARAIVVEDTNQILKDGITEDSAALFAQFIASQVPTDSNLRGSKEYRSHLAEVLTKRNILSLGGKS